DLFIRVGRGTYRLRHPSDQNPDQSAHEHLDPDGSILFDNTKLPASSLARLTVVQAAVRIMREHPERPMHYEELAKIANSRGYSSFRSNSMETLSNTFRELLRREAQKPDSLIRRVRPGYFRLAEVQDIDDDEVDEE